MDVYDVPDAEAWSQVTDAVSIETQMKQTCLRQNMITN